MAVCLRRSRRPFWLKGSLFGVNLYPSVLGATRDGRVVCDRARFSKA
ncbi:MAG: hypothetical protein ACJATT_001757, partial [Myxococcota bacterium]